MTSPSRSENRRAILRIVVIYILLGGLWIYTSGTILDAFVCNATLRANIELLKGFLFVILTSLLLYLLISRHVQQLETSRKSLRETDERLGIALAAARMGVWEWNLRTNAVFWSPECYDIVGLKDFNGSFEAFAELIHPDDKAHVMETVAQSLALDNAYTDEFRIIRPDGRLCWLLNHGRVTYDAERTPLLLVGTVQDVTGRKKMGEMLKESEERFRSIVENSPYMIMIHADGKYVYLNPAAVENFGITDQQEYIGKPIIEAVHPDFRDRVRDRISTIYRDNQPVLKSEQQLLRKDGSAFWAEITGTPTVFDGSKSVQVIAVDITARKQYETELRGYSHRLIEMDENLRKHLAAELHDEIGRDLAALGMNLAVISKSAGDAEPEKVSEKIQDTVKLVESISRTVRGIMAGLRPPVLDDFGLVAALRWHVGLYAKRTGITVDVQAEDAFPRLLAETETALFRIAQEALMNAAKHAEGHSVKVSLEHDDEVVRLAIADTGNGFVPGAFNHQEDGSGWGLKIMRERAETVGGRFQVESIPGGGTSVSVTVPVKEA